MSETVLLSTKLGQLRGQKRTSNLSNKTYYSFQGIPYGKPPLGDLRFKAPLPFGSWEGVRDALNCGNISKQPILVKGLIKSDGSVAIGDEDCLYLNVYVNELPKDSGSRWPVMFHIHGGGFMGGGGAYDYFGPDFIICENVVLVSINYRCGPFGFLSLEDEEVPGNAGLKDQTLALMWVKDNIESFGGDPNNVTVFGVSAGGASVHYHLLSQSSAGLFHKAIMQSGVALSGWAFNPEPRKTALSLAKTLGCNSVNNSEVIKFLQSVSADDIVTAVDAIRFDQSNLGTLSFFFTPCVEVVGADPFLTDTPINLMRGGKFNKVPVIMGCTTNEGSLIMMIDRLMNRDKFEKLKRETEPLVPVFFNHKDKQAVTEAGEAIWNFYFKEKTLPWESKIKDFQTFVSDACFLFGTEKTRQYLLKNSDQPLYSYSFTNHSKCFCYIFKGEKSKETCHVADIPFITAVRGMTLPTDEMTPEHKDAVTKHVKAWTAFASLGHPTNEVLGTVWRQDMIAKPCFMDIGPFWIMKDGIPFAERMEFWEKLLDKYSLAE